jgi:two-component system, sensor histidine kinase and response regulator
VFEGDIVETIASLPKVGRRRFGIRAKLLVAVGAVAVMTLLGGALTWRSYSQIEKLLVGVTRDNLPSLSAAMRLSEVTTRLAVVASGLDGAQSQAQREVNFRALQLQERRLRALIDSLADQPLHLGNIAELQALATDVADNISNRNQLVHERLDLVDRNQDFAATVDRLQKALDSLVAYRDHMDVDLKELLEATDILRAVVLANDLERLSQLRRGFDDHARAVSALAVGTRQGGVNEYAVRVQRLGSGADSIFALRTQLLSAEARLVVAVEDGHDTVARISGAMRQMVAAAQGAAVANEVGAEAVLREGRFAMMVIALVTFLGPLLFLWIFLGRNVVNRLAVLAESMKRIVNGDYLTPVMDDGDDEIADMAAEMGVFQDALARLHDSTAALKESEQRFRTILDTSPLPLAISLAGDHRLVYVNPRWCELYMVEYEDARAATARDFYSSAEDRQRVVDLVMRQGFVGDFETRMHRDDGQEFWAMLSAARIDLDGQPAVIVSTIDITKRKEQEEALADAKKLAEEASQAKTLFLATMSHEIRTPMNGVLTMAELLGDMHQTSEQREVTQVIRESAVSLLTIINDILDFSKIESGKMALETVEVSVTELVEGVAELLAPRAFEKGIGLFTCVDPTLSERCMGDPVRLRQIITNLAGNAIKFTARGCVRIDVEAVAGGAVTFSIIDTGIGLDGPAQSRLFEPFSQADASISRRYGGTGLGLSICRRLVAMMGGEIGVTSRPGDGANFWFTVPLPAADQPAGPPPDLSGIGVLVLAEGPVDAEILRRYVGHLGAQVTSVASTEGALAAVRSARLAGWAYDVVMLDGSMDFRARLALAGALRSAAAVDTVDDSTQVVMVVPHAAQAQAARDARAAGLFAALSKPLRRSVLWRTIAAAAGRGTLEEEDRDERVVEVYVPPSIEEAANANALILVAEDNPTNQLVIRRLMERLGYAIHLAEHGLEAWERMQVRDYGLLLTDCHMPEMDGYELTERVRNWEKGGLTRIPIVALTADAFSGTAARCRECGMDAFLAKPIDLAQLDATIRRLLPQAVPLRRRRVVEADAESPVAAPQSEPEDGQLAILDLSPLREIFGSITDEARELLTLFIDTTRPLLTDMDNAVVAGDTAAAREAAHSGKGAGNSAGAYRFGKICAEIEAACTQGEMDRVVARVPAMHAAFADVVQAVAEV